MEKMVRWRGDSTPKEEGEELEETEDEEEIQDNESPSTN
jgi:hypothetical protein